MRPRSLLTIAAFAATSLLTPAAASAFTHVVVPGESLSSVAAADGLTLEELAAANGLSGEAQLIAGTDLTIPEQGLPANPAAAEEGEAATEPASGGGGGGGYVVEPGDTLSAIAAREGTTVEELASLNGFDPEGVLLSGAVIDVPGATSEPSSVGPYPTEESVSPSQVGAIAEEHGISPSLAEAVAEQESGFDNGLTSSTDARGVMQIEPETWSFISRDLAGPPPLDEASASSNVRGGVLLLRYLLNETGGDPGAAAAGYFQGLESVRRHGEYPETEAYVNSVLALKSRFAGE
jgi:LysM repeat protein